MDLLDVVQEAKLKVAKLKVCLDFERIFFLFEGAVTRVGVCFML